MFQDPPGPVLGTGRTADVYALDQDRVLRRYREPIDVQSEAEKMRYLAGAGFPVPVVYDADGTDLVMERLDGQDMLLDFSKRPWLVRQHARTLAGLHNRLHQIQAPAGWPQLPYAPGDRVLHLDLHPGNVMLTSRGPVVIDWTGARAGAAGADVAVAYLLLATGEPDQLPATILLAVKALRVLLYRQFLASAQDDPTPYLAAAARLRMTDPHVLPLESARLGRVADRAERSARQPADTSQR
jgi:Ser/Thr protein kinase RdoA (MazF antagonist)